MMAYKIARDRASRALSTKEFEYEGTGSHLRKLPVSSYAASATG